MIKKILIGLVLVVVGLVGLVAVVSLVSPTDFAVEREVVVNKPKDEVFAYAKLLKNQNDWGPWFKQDPAMMQEYTGTDGTPGFTSKWVSQEVGSGEQEIKRIVEGERIETELRFTAPFESKADCYITTEAVGENQTKVKWGFKSSMPRPMNLLTLVMDMDAAIGKDFEDGLASLKSILETK
ncbi:MAG: SRPBCC family protein [Acidobacteria bacterium]|nr:SRPBCC family protein [Acidobacteriota bacterium]